MTVISKIAAGFISLFDIRTLIGKSKYALHVILSKMPILMYLRICIASFT